MKRFTISTSVTKSTAPHTGRRCRLAGLCALLSIALALSAAPLPKRGLAAPFATLWYVSPTGNDANDCLTTLTACAHIEATINKAASGDTINIAAGTYTENLSVYGYDNLTLQGAGQLTTIIDGQGLIGSVVTINNATVNLSGLTVRNGRYDYGAGVYVYPASTANLTDSRIIDNIGQNGGGGILNNGRLKMTNVSLSNNTNLGSSDRGGGLLNLGAAELINCTVTNNQSLSNGGGGIGNRGVLTITGGTLSGNEAGSGGAIYNENSLVLNATLISRNQARGASGGGIYNAGLGFNQGSVIDSGSTITENVAATSGGGVHNTSTGNLVLVGTRIMSNTATSGVGGGGLYSDGTASLTNVSVKDNRAVSGSGGGLYSASVGSNLTINQSQIINNQSAANGGGLFSNGTVLLSYVNMNNNRASNGSGGGVYNAAGQLTLAQSELSGNIATIGNGGGLFNGATANLTQVSIQNNQSASGGGLYNDLTGQLLVAASTVYKNNSVQSTGGGINNLGTLTVTQSTLYSNTTTLQGGSGLYNNASARLTNVTFSYNAVLSATTGAILNENGALTVLNSTISHNAWPALARTSGSIALANTIVAASTGGVNCNNPLTSNGYNLDSGSSCGLGAAGDINSTDPLLGPLNNNGGATLTRALMSNSPALDAGNDASCASVDQRGVTRPQGDHCDIGAYETIGYSNNITETVAAGSCVTSSLVISDSYLIGSLQIGANLTFAPRGDLRVNLHSPNNTVIHLLGATGGSGQNLAVLWDDESTSGPVGNEDHDVNLEYWRVPDQSLSPLSGRSVRGTWQLEACSVSSASGTLNRWSIIVPSFGNPKIFLPVIRR